MTKKEKTAALVAGIALFVTAAVFTISIFLGVFDYGTSGNFLAGFGRMLVSVYGFCSALIPAFFFTAGVFCFSAKWSLSRALCLAISVIPFITMFSAERTSRLIARADVSPIAALKIITLMVMAILLVVLEYLLTVMIASRISSGKSLTKAALELALSLKNHTKNAVHKNSERKNKTAVQKTDAKVPAKEEPAPEKPLPLSNEDATVSEAKLYDEDIWSIDDEGNVKEQESAFVQNGAPVNEVTPAFEEDSADDRDIIDEFESENMINVQSVAEEDVQDEKSDKDAEGGAEDNADSYEDVVSLQDSTFPDEEMPFDDDEFLTEDEEEDYPELMDGGEEDVQDESTDEDVSESGNIIEDNFNIEDNEPSEDTDAFETVSDADDDDYDIEDDLEDNTEEIGENSQDAGFGVESEEENADVLPSTDTVSKLPAPEPNPQTRSMVSALDEVFSRMDDDARRAALNSSTKTESDRIDPTAPPVVDSNGQPIAVTTDAQGNTTPVKIPPKRRVKHGPYKISTELLTAYDENPYWIIDDDTKKAAQNLKETLREFKIEAEVVGIRKGPVVTMFEILPARGINVRKIVGLQDNIALRLAASSVRIVAPIPGKSAVGIEIPNSNRAIVSFRECIEKNTPEWKKMAVPVILGKDIQGETQIMDLVKTPHLLIAGSTGSGKSVCVNSMILSILYKRSPNEVKLILIDPKIVELKLYNGIPHLLTPVITDPKRAMQALQYCLCEMERRYALLDSLGCRDISSYNRKIVEQHIATEKIPYLIVVIDEFADLMATTGKQLESVVARLAAMSRAVGIHLVLATQRPSIDVITGLIKANIPSRVAFMVASKMDSRIIIDQVGAEKLLGKGDMLYASATDPFPVRIQGAFISDQEVEDVVDAVKEWGEPEYIDDEIFVDDDDDENSDQMSLFSGDGEDPLYEKALQIVVQAGKASASYIQRRLKIGYNRAARLVEDMEDRGIVGPANGSKPREIIHMP